jgi:hypothetical protein
VAADALKLAYATKAKGCKLMVGNMVETSLGMASSFVVDAFDSRFWG